MKCTQSVTIDSQVKRHMALVGRYWADTGQLLYVYRVVFFRKVFNATHSFSVSICAGSHLSVLIIIAAYYQICVFKEGVCFKIRYV